MDWDKYKSFGNNYNWDVSFLNFLNTISNVPITNGFNNYPNDNAVADVTDSYKELSSERIE